MVVLSIIGIGTGGEQRRFVAGLVRNPITFLCGCDMVCVLSAGYVGAATVQTTYAMAYEVLQQQPEEPVQPVSAKALPWDDYNAE